MAGPGDITVLLQEAEAGRDGALDRLMERVYADLERIALSQLSRRYGQRLNALTIEPAALVNETFLRLIKQRKTCDNRGQFFAIATRIMLRVLVDYQRERRTERRGGGSRRLRLSLDNCAVPVAATQRATQVEIEPLVEALERLETFDPRQADIVKMRVVWGLEVKEIADSLGLSTSTVKRDWRFARAWLMDEVMESP